MVGVGVYAHKPPMFSVSFILLLSCSYWPALHHRSALVTCRKTSVALCIRSNASRSSTEGRSDLQTNVFDKMDINLDVLRHIHFAESGNFTVKFNYDLSLRNESLKNTRNYDQGLARIEYFMGDRNKGDVYLMKDTEIVIARKEPENLGYSNYLLLDSQFVSNPHARIRLNESTGKFQIASFSINETRVNEVVIAKSDAAMPRWFDLEPKSQVMLNGMVTLEFKQF